jgi:hypothetical protein
LNERHSQSGVKPPYSNIESQETEMPSLFPGMDPWLEGQWQPFHGWFIRELARLTIPKAQKLGCWIDVDRTVYQHDPSGEVTLLGAPDETVWLAARDWSPDQSNGGGSVAQAVALAPPKAIHEVVLKPDELQRVKQEYLVVRELEQARRVLAVVEVLSPGNKSGSYVSAYRAKRRTLLAGTIHFMEIDLLRAGENP